MTLTFGSDIAQAGRAAGSGTELVELLTVIEFAVPRRLLATRDGTGPEQGPHQDAESFGGPIRVTRQSLPGQKRRRNLTTGFGLSGPVLLGLSGLAMVGLGVFARAWSGTSSGAGVMLVHLGAAAGAAGVRRLSCGVVSLDLSAVVGGPEPSRPPEIRIIGPGGVGGCAGPAPGAMSAVRGIGVGGVLARVRGSTGWRVVSLGDHRGGSGTQQGTQVEVSDQRVGALGEIADVPGTDRTMPIKKRRLIILAGQRRLLTDRVHDDPGLPLRNLLLTQRRGTRFFVGARTGERQPAQACDSGRRPEHALGTGVVRADPGDHRLHRLIRQTRLLSVRGDRDPTQTISEITTGHILPPPRLLPLLPLRIGVALVHHPIGDPLGRLLRDVPGRGERTGQIGVDLRHDRAVVDDVRAIGDLAEHLRRNDGPAQQVRGLREPLGGRDRRPDQRTGGPPIPGEVAREEFHRRRVRIEQVVLVLARADPVIQGRQRDVEELTDRIQLLPVQERLPPPRRLGIDGPRPALRLVVIGPVGRHHPGRSEIDRGPAGRQRVADRVGHGGHLPRSECSIYLWSTVLAHHGVRHLILYR